MRVLFLILLILVAVPAQAQPARPASEIGATDRIDLQRVITDQIAAFRRDDAEAAFAFASPGIQRLFGTPETFIAMVRAGYQPVYRPRAFTFRELFLFDGRLIQEVALIGPDGRRATALYDMERQADGSWRIAGCQLVEPEDANS